MATTTIPASTGPATTVPVNQGTIGPGPGGGVQAAAVSTIPFDGIPMTQAIEEGYGNRAKSEEDLAGMTKAKITDFRANMQYEVAWRIGVVNTGTPEEPVFEDRYEMKPVYIYGDIVSGSIEFYNAVMTGNAFNVAPAPSTTMPGTPVTTTTVPVTTTTVPVTTTTVPVTTTTVPVTTTTVPVTTTTVPVTTTTVPVTTTTVPVTTTTVPVTTTTVPVTTTTVPVTTTTVP